MSPPPMKPGTRKLSESARHVVLPEGIVSTGWPAVRAKCVELGVLFDPWQDGLGRAILGKRGDGKYAAGIGGVVLSIPRQVGKTYTIGAVIFALCVLCPGLTVIWTAHHNRTTTETFMSMQAMAKRIKIRPFILQVLLGSGDEEIRFRNGSRIMFGARERGFGRGMAKVDVEVFDEAQILTERALDALVPATNQSKQPAGALLFFMGTPPKPTDPSEAFTAKRKKALAGVSRDTLYVEFGADECAKVDDRKQWAIANPSFPLRTPVEAMSRMRENLTDDSFRREALGVWDREVVGVFPVDAWGLCADPGSGIAGRPVLALAMSLDRAKLCLAAAGRRGDGLLHIEIVKHGVAGAGFVAEVARISVEHGAQVIVHPHHAVGSLIPELETAKVRLKLTNSIEYTQACGAYFDAVVEHRVRYVPEQPELEAAMAVATQKYTDQTWKWRGEGITALVAASQALYAASNAPVGGKGRAIAFS